MDVTVDLRRPKILCAGATSVSPRYYPFSCRPRLRRDRNHFRLFSKYDQDVICTPFDVESVLLQDPPWLGVVNVVGPHATNFKLALILDVHGSHIRALLHIRHRLSVGIPSACCRIDRPWAGWLGSGSASGPSWGDQFPVAPIHVSPTAADCVGLLWGRGRTCRAVHFGFYMSWR